MNDPSPHQSRDQRAMASEVIVGDRRPTGRTPLLDIEKVAIWLGTSPRHVRRLVAERKIPFVKVGHFIRFDGEEIARWIDGKRVGPSHPTAGA